MKSENRIFIRFTRNDGTVNELEVSSDIDTAYNFSYIYYANCVRCGEGKKAEMIVNGEVFRQYPVVL